MWNDFVGAIKSITNARLVRWWNIPDRNVPTTCHTVKPFQVRLLRAGVIRPIRRVETLPYIIPRVNKRPHLVL
jgi:hypothetical protein